MIFKLFKIPKSVIVVHGWHYITHSLVIFFAKLRGHTVCLRYEMPYNQELLKGGWKQNLKRKFLKQILFSRIQHFLFIGSQNRSLYENVYKIPADQLSFCPYSVDNERFQKEHQQLTFQREALKTKLNIPATDHIILFSGKYIDKKRPLDILKAFSELRLKNCWLIMLGEGELRPEMEAFIRDNNVERVILTGFVNQSQVAEFYTISDVFVMCSSIGETWGLSVNEAMNFQLPLIVSDLTGCSTDLVQNGENGYVFKTGDVQDLKEKLASMIENIDTFKSKNSSTLLQQYSYATIKDCLETLIKN